MQWHGPLGRVLALLLLKCLQRGLLLAHRLRELLRVLGQARALLLTGLQADQGLPLCLQPDLRGALSCQGVASLCCR